MLNVISQKLKDQLRGALYYLSGLVGYVWLMIALFPSINRNMNLDEYISQMPKDMIKFFSGNETLSYSKIEGFLSMEYLSVFFVLIIVFYLAAASGAAVAGAIDRKTMDFQLSQPISRTQLILAETVVGLIYTSLLVGMTALAIYLLCLAYDIDILARGLTIFALTATAFMWAIFGFALFLSSVLRTKMTVVAATIFVVLASYIFTSLSNIVEKLEPYRKFSIFYLYKPQTLLESSSINWNHLGILSAVFILGLVSALLIFNRRDI